MALSQPGQIVCKTISLKQRNNNNNKKRAITKKNPSTAKKKKKNQLPLNWTRATRSRKQKRIYTL
jgi:hypothetical protein